MKKWLQIYRLRNYHLFTFSTFSSYIYRGRLRLMHVCLLAHAFTIAKDLFKKKKMVEMKTKYKHKREKQAMILSVTLADAGKFKTKITIWRKILSFKCVFVIFARDYIIIAHHMEEWAIKKGSHQNVCDFWVTFKNI